MQTSCRWGILGTANIARKNWKAMRLAGNATLTAVASRDAAKARAFIDLCQADSPFAKAPAACSYDELLRRDDVDAIYFPVPTGIRRDWVVRAAQAGKHVLCEKPCAPTAADVRAMIDACRAQRVQFMDGVMFMHSKRLPLLRQVLDDGESVGAIRRVVSQFTFAASDEFRRSNIRSKSDLEPLGCLGDLGWYNIRFNLWAMKYRLPETVSGHLISGVGTGEQTVPFDFAGELLFTGGVTGGFYCSFNAHLQQWAHVSGTRGAILVPDFVLPYYGCEASFEANAPNIKVEGCSYHWESHPRRFAVREYSDGAADAQETNMIRNFSAIVTSGNLDASWSDIALKTQIVLDACLQSARANGRPVPCAQ
jgi:predicted dehydrogenase